MARDKKKLRGKLKKKIQDRVAKIPVKVLNRLDAIERDREDLIGYLMEAREEFAGLANPLVDPEPMRMIIAKLFDNIIGNVDPLDDRPGQEEDEGGEEEQHE